MQVGRNITYMKLLARKFLQSDDTRFVGLTRDGRLQINLSDFSKVDNTLITWVHLFFFPEKVRGH